MPAIILHMYAGILLSQYIMRYSFGPSYHISIICDRHRLSQVDCFSFAIVLWALLAWRLPFRGKTTFHVRGTRPCVMLVGGGLGI